MPAWVVILLVCGGYLVVTLVMGLLPGRRVSASVTGYVAGDRSMNVVLLYFVLGASVFSSFAFLGAPGWAYSRGAAAFYTLAYGIVGMTPLYFLGPRCRRIGARLGFVTQAEVLAHRYASRPLSTLLALISVAAFIPYLTLQMKGAGYILATVSEGRIPEWLGAGITYGVVLAYVLGSGVMGVGWTNTFQGLFMMGIAWFLGLYLPHHLYGGIGAMFEALEAEGHAAMLRAPGLTATGDTWDWWGFSSSVLVSAVGLSMWPHLFMKSFAARSDRTLRLTVVLYPTFQLFLVPILLMGFAGILAFPGVTPPDTIVPHLLTRVGLSPVVVGLVCAGVLAASMSSGDAILHAGASVLVRDGLRPYAPARFDEERERRWIRWLAVVLCGVAYYFAVASDVSLVDLLLGAYGGIVQLFPLVFAAFYWPRATGKGALAGLLAGTGVTVFFLLMPEVRPVPLHEGLYGLMVNGVVLVLVSLLTPPEAAATLAPYYEDREEDAQ